MPASMGKKDTGTENLLLTLIDRIKKLQDNQDTPKVILSAYDWMGAFDINAYFSESGAVLFRY